ncbi:MAG: hypothetical protein JWR38_589 [Mucilaginibacter sp.]|nr:hypothetical protein [Mucilaginibacter sp.]
MFFGLILGIKQFIFFPEQRLLLGVFLCMLIFSLVAQASVNDVGAILRSFKEILYIPIIYWASCIKNKKQTLKYIVFFGCVAYSANILLYLQNFSVDNTIWSGPESISSGMSNRGFDILSFQLVQLSGLAHGIWGSYCVLIFILAVSLKKTGVISGKQLFIVGVLFFINIVITISRETILVLIIIYALSFLRSKISILKRALIVGSFIMIIIAIAIWGSSLPVVQKISYTYEALSESGSEGNFSLRVNTWQAYFTFLGSHVEYIFMGLGLSPDNFYNHISNYTHQEIVSVPESAMVYTQAYGGIFSFLFFFTLIITAAFKINKNSAYKLIKYFFIGILITNVMSSVSMFSDLLYAHLCLIYGLLIVKNNEIKSDAIISES